MARNEFYQQLLDVLESGASAVVVSVYKDSGNVENSLVSDRDAEAWAGVESLLAQPGISICGPVAHSIASDGTLTVIERYSAKPRLIILGGGHVALALAQIAKLVDFEIVVYDDRPNFANPQRFPQAEQVICDGFENLFERVHINKTDYVVLVTRGHKYDFDCLAGVLSGIEPLYTGMIGSKRRAGIVMEQLRQAGFDKERIARIHTPIGLKIGGVTPAEIAISIIAELISVKRLEGAARNLISCDQKIIESLAEPDYAPDALVTIFNTKGSVPLDAGAKLSMTYAGVAKGTIGGGCSEAEAMLVARDVIRDGGWRMHMVDMKDSAEEDGMVCGGEMHLIIELA